MARRHAVTGFAVTAALVTACGVDSANSDSISAPSPTTSGPAPQEFPYAENGAFCTVQADGQPVPEMQGVSARDGECIVNLDSSLASTAHGEATPEEAIRSTGFGRFGLVRFQPDSASASQVYFYESDNGRRVGEYGVNVMPDGSFILHRFVASLPISGYKPHH